MSWAVRSYEFKACFLKPFSVEPIGNFKEGERSGKSGRTHGSYAFLRNKKAAQDIMCCRSVSKLTPIFTCSTQEKQFSTTIEPLSD